jgi:hypothetical protein
MANNDKYQVLHDAITYQVPVAAKYKGKDRKFWPILLGTSPVGNSQQTQEMVVGLEYEYDGNAVNPMKYRCYKVLMFPTKPTITSVTVPKDPLKGDISRQNCVITADPTLPLP